MIPILAFRIQELSHGGLNEETKMKLQQFISATNSNTRRGPPKKFVVGTRLVREWKGKVHDVAITADGFEYQGERYKTLSPIACRITGTHWSGPPFSEPRTKSDGKLPGVRFILGSPPRRASVNPSILCMPNGRLVKPTS
jgi:hypothetical protein